MQHQLLSLTVLNGAAALLGLYFLFRARQASRKHENSHLLVLAFAVGFLTAGVLVEGFAVRVLDWPIASAHVLEASLSLVGFGLLVYSLHS